MITMIEHIGKVYPSFFRYYNKHTEKIELKSRPVLIVGIPQLRSDKEVIVLPISTLRNKHYYNPYYDVKLDNRLLEECKFHDVCYARTHKRTVIYRGDIDFVNCIGDIKGSNPEVYETILKRMHSYDEYLYERNLNLLTESMNEA